MIGFYSVKVVVKDRRNEKWRIIGFFGNRNRNPATANRHGWLSKRKKLLSNQMIIYLQLLFLFPSFGRHYKQQNMNLRQLFDEDSSTYTYLLWDAQTHDGILIDPVDTQVERDIAVAQENGVNLLFGINTHAHADHITGTYLLKQKLSGFKSVIAGASGAIADILIKPGDRITFGSRHVEAIPTPGHTDGCMSYVTDDQSMVFTGDALLIQGCGRTDFQQGSSSTLYDSIHSKLFTLPDSCIVYPGHDYKGRLSSTIGHEKENNPRLGLSKTKDEFIDIMTNLNLPHPRKIHVAVPANLRDGEPVA